MRIEILTIENYRLFRHAELRNLPRMAVIVGANGTGKSTLFDVFSFLKDALAMNVAVAVARRGGFRELVSRETQGPIKLTIKFRESSGRLATYRLVVGEEKGRAIVEREVLAYRRGQHGRPWHFVDFHQGTGKAIANESAYGKQGTVEERVDYALDDPSILAIKGLGQFRKFRVVAEFRNLIERWHISDLRIADARPSAEIGYAEHLSARGDNLALVTQYLFENYPECFTRILDAMRLRVPGVSHVEAKPTMDGRLVLRFQDEAFADPFMAHQTSDGTIKMFAYLTLLYDPKPHPLLAVEEPENQLYPRLMREIAEEFRDYARRGSQVFVATHSPEFLNCIALDEIFFLTKRDGFATARQASQIPLLQNLIAAGDRPGMLWNEGLLEKVVT